MGWLILTLLLYAVFIPILTTKHSLFCSVASFQGSTSQCVLHSEKHSVQKKEHLVVKHWIYHYKFSTTGSFYAKVEEKCEKIIDFLSVNVSPVGLATELEIAGLITKHVRGLADVTTVPVPERIRPVIVSVISRLKLKEENAEKFKSVLQKLEVLEDVMHIID